MRVYWRKVKWGQSLILSNEDDGQEEDLGGFRETKRGIDALAKTFRAGNKMVLSYDAGRSRKGFPTIEEAKAFVESFKPWELFGAQVATVDPEVRPALDSAETDTAGTPDQPAESVVSELLTTKGWWQFWKKG